MVNVSSRALGVSGSLISNAVETRRSPRLGFTVLAAMLAGTALAPAAAQVADLGGATVNISDFSQLAPPNPTEITNGLLRVSTVSGLSFGGNLTDSLGLFGLQKLGAGTLTLSGVNSYSGTTSVSAGTLIAGSTTAFSANSLFSVTASGALDLNGFSNSIGGLSGNGGARVTNSSATAATLTVNVGGSNTFGGGITGNMALVKTGPGTLVLNDLQGASNYSGGTSLAGGTLQVGSNGALGTGALAVDAASTLGFSNNDRVIANNIVLNDELTVIARTSTLSGTISGAGGISKGGNTALTLTAANSFSGGVTALAGGLVLGDNQALGTGALTTQANIFLGFTDAAANYTLANNFVLSGGNVNFRLGNAGTTTTLDGTVSGAGGIFLQQGGGVLLLTAANSYTGATLLDFGVLGLGNLAALGNTAGITANPGGAMASYVDGINVTAGIRGNGDLAYDTRGFNAALSGRLRDTNVLAGEVMTLVKNGAGILTIANTSASPGTANDFTGGIVVNGGTLNLTGRVQTGVTVRSGATLAGTGTDSAGFSQVEAGGFLSPGDALTPGSVGTLSLANLTLDPGSTSIFDLASPNFALGGANGSDFVVVADQLVLGGTLDVRALGGFGVGSYALFRSNTGNIGGSFATLTLPTAFLGNLSIDGNFVRLDVLNPSNELWWDGSGPFANGIVDGNAGVWSLTNGNWTDAAGNLVASWGNSVTDSIGWFTNTGGAVVVDATGSMGGALNFNRLNFTTSGYTISGDGLNTDAGIIDVTAGNSATIDSAISGVNGLAKEGAGTLVLGGANSFTGGLAINGGTVGVTQAGALGADAVSISAANTLRFDASMTVTNAINGSGVGYNIDTNGNTVRLEGSLSGGGADKEGAGTLILANAVNAQPSTLAVFGGTLIVEGGVQGNVGAIGGTVIGGTGTISDLLSTNGTLSPGAAPGLVGTLTAGRATLTAGSTSLFDLGALDGVNDLMQIGGDLSLDGTLEVNPLAGWNVGVGSYRLFNFGGTLTDNGLALGASLLTAPTGVSYAIDTATAGQVNLVRSYAGEYNWDGDNFAPNGAVDGGTSTWSLTSTNFANADGTFNLAWGNQAGLAGTVGNFGGTAGTITLDGDFNFRRLNFLVGGYVLDGGSLNMDAGIIDVATGDARINSTLTGTNGLIVGGGGSLTLTGTNSYTGGTLLAGGSLVVGSDGALGAGDLGTLGGTTVVFGLATSPGVSAGPITLANNIVLQGNTTFNLVGTTAGVSSFTGSYSSTGTTATLDGVISGTGALTVTGAGVLALNGNNSYSGGTSVLQALVEVGNANAFGTGDVALGSTAALRNNSGSTISLANNVAINGIAVTMGGTNDLALTGNLSGTGNLFKVNGTTLEIAGATNDFGGNLTVNGGAVLVNGTMGNAAANVQVNGAGLLGGNGTIAGTVTIGNGGILAAGNSPGALTIGNLNLEAGSLLNFELGAANTLGGPLNDRIIVTGNLVLDGTLNVTESAGGSFGLGIYNLFSYGSLTDNGLAIGGALPNGFTGTVQINGNANQVNLIVADAGVALLNWDGTDFTAATPGAQGGSGVFNLTNTNWTGDAPGEINGAWVNNAIGIFGTVGGTVDVADSIGFTGFAFQADGYTLGGAGGLVTNAGTGSFVGVDGGFTATINTAISGSGALFKQGAGALVLGGDNSHSGGTTIQGGSLGVASNTALGTGGLTIGNGTTLFAAAADVALGNSVVIQGTGTVDSGAGGLALGGPISGGALTKIGSGTLSLSGDNSYTGGTALNAGTIVVGSDTALGTGALTMAGGTTLANGGADIALANDVVINGISTIDSGNGLLTLDGVVSGPGTLSKTGSGELALNGVNTYAGGTSVLAGTISAGNGSAFGTGDITLFGGTTLAANADLALANNIALFGSAALDNRGNTLTIDGTISGSGPLVALGGGNLVLSVDNGYTGGTDLAEGTITVGASGALGGGDLSMADGTTLAAGTTDLTVLNNISIAGLSTIGVAVDQFTLAGTIDGSGTLVKTGAGNLTLSGANLYTGGTNLNAGSITVGNDAALGTGTLTMAGGTALIAGVDPLTLGNAIALNGAASINGGAGLVTLNGVISGAGGLTKIGSGTLVLNGDNSYEGGTSVGAGTVVVGTSTALGTGALALGAGTTLAAGGADLNVGNAIAIAGGATVDVAGEVFTLSGIVSGTGPLSVIDSAANPAAALLLTGLNTYTGGTSVTGTTLQVNQNENLGAAAGGLTLTDATLRANGNVNAATRAVVLGGAGGTFDVLAANTVTIGGVVSGTGLTKTGTGTLTLNGANTHTGGTALNGGRINVGNNSALGTGALAMADGTTLGASATGVTIGNAIGITGTGTIDSSVAAFTITGVISGDSLVKTGTGNLVLNGVNTFTGGSTLAGGTTTIGNASALGTGPVTIGDGATLAAGVTGITFGNAITTQGNGTINSGASPSTLTITSVIGGAGGITKAGTGTLFLNAANTYTGPTFVAAGTLNVAGSLVSAVTVQTGGTLAGTGSVGGLTVNSGGTVSPGAAAGTVGTLTVNGPASLLAGSTYIANVTPAAADRITASGPLSLGGTLQLAGSGTFTTFNATYTLASGSTRTGEFGSVTGNNTFGPAFRPLVSYNATSAILTLAPNFLETLGTQFGPLSPNQLEAARAIDRAVVAGFNPQAFFPLYNQGSNINAAIGQITGEVHAAERRVMLEDTRVVRETALDRLNAGLSAMAGQSTTADSGDAQIGMFMRGAGSWSTASADGTGSRFTTDQYGILTGIDYSRDGYKVGGMFHYTTTDVRFATLGQSDVESVGGTIYGGYRKPDNGIAVGLGASVARTRAQSNRAITVPGLAQTLTASNSGTVWQAFGEIAYDLVDAADMRVEPFVRLAYTQLDMNALNETGGVAALTAAEQKLDFTVATAGIRGAKQIGNWTLSGSAGWQSLHGDRSAATLMGIPAAGQVGRIQAVQLDLNAAAIQADVGYRFSDTVNFTLGYSGIIGKYNTDQAARATLSIGF